MNRVIDAIDFATKAHNGQVRKYTGEPYVMHPIAVSIIVASVSDNVNMHCAAVLHDVVEDTDIAIDDIAEEFGYTVAMLVNELTDVSKSSDGNRKTRKELDRIHLSAASNDSKTIKLADLINNSGSIIEHDRRFAKIYMQEKAELLKVLVGGNKELHKKATAIVDKYLNEKTLTN